MLTLYSQNSMRPFPNLWNGCGLTSSPEAAMLSLASGVSISQLAVADSVRCGTREWNRDMLPTASMSHGILGSTS